MRKPLSWGGVLPAIDVFACNRCLCSSLPVLPRFRSCTRLAGSLITSQLVAHQSSLVSFLSGAIESRTVLAPEISNIELSSGGVARIAHVMRIRSSFMGELRFILQPRVARLPSIRKCSIPVASWITSSQIASNVFTLGTAAVLPFYTLMVVAPKAEFTKRTMESSMPYVILGALYAYLLHLSWTPDTFQLMFASKYWLPELQGIAKMFSNEMTLASAWIHLLAVDLFAARQVYHDGLNNEIETRHSVSLCLLFCPIGILTHILTKALSGKAYLERH